MKIYKQINESDLISYLGMVQDTNPLHYEGTRIIPGNLLLFILEQVYREKYQERLKYIKASFYSPAYLNKSLCFVFNHNTFQIKDANQTVILKGEWKNE